MRIRLPAAGALLLLILAACGGGPAASGPAATGSAATGSASTPAAIDLSQVDVCAVVPAGTAETLTGETGFDADGSSSASSAKCFWGVPRPGVPQYLEIEISRAPSNLEGQGLTLNGVSCPGGPVPGVGVAAVGGVCPGAQTLVWLAAMDQGVLVRVLVNEPKGALTPAGLADVMSGIIAALE
jgi:hypothetical protein